MVLMGTHKCRVENSKLPLTPSPGVLLQIYYGLSAGRYASKLIL